MTLPLIIPESLIFIPQIFSLIGLFILAFAIEKRFTSRLTILANAFLLIQIMVPIWLSLNDYLQGYVYLGIGFSVLALLSRLGYFAHFTHHLYKMSHLLYGSKTVLGLSLGILIATTFGILSVSNGVIVGLVIAGAIWFATIKYLGHEFPLRF